MNFRRVNVTGGRIAFRALDYRLGLGTADAEQVPGCPHAPARGGVIALGPVEVG